MSEKKDNVVPFIKDKRTRDIVKNDFKRASLMNPANTLNPTMKEQLDRINRTMEEIKELRDKSEEYLQKHAPELASPREQVKAPAPYPDEVGGLVVTTEPAFTIDEEKARRDYIRKQEEARKKREYNNAKVTQEYNLVKRGYTPRKPARKRDDDR